MQRYLAAGLAGLMITVWTVPAAAATVTETFVDAASATANGWTDSGNAGSNEFYGFSNTNNAVGAASGEARGSLHRSTVTGYYADTTLGLTLDFTQAFEASGRIQIANFGNSDLGNGAFVGFFKESGTGLVSNGNGDFTFAGLEFNGGGWKPFVRYDNNGVERVTLSTGRSTAPASAVDFSFDWDPTGGALNAGRLTATLGTSTLSVETTTTTQGSRLAEPDAFLDAFGIIRPQVGNTNTNDNVTFFLDDVTYTHAGASPPNGPGDFGDFNPDLTGARVIIRDVTETFDTLSSAQSNGWAIGGSGSNSDGYGVTSTTNTGAASGAGEARASMSRNANSGFFGDTELGTTFTINRAFSFSTTLVFDDMTDSGNGTYFGFFDKDRSGANGPSGNVSVMGLFFNNKSGSLVGNLQGQVWHDTGGPGFLPGFNQFNSTIPLDTPTDVAFSYDPEAGTHGRLTITINNTTGTLDLTATQRSQLADMELDSLGFYRPGVSGSSGNTIAFADDATYSEKADAFITEPNGAASLGSLAALGGQLAVVGTDAGVIDITGITNGVDGQTVLLALDLILSSAADATRVIDLALELQTLGYDVSIDNPTLTATGYDLAILLEYAHDTGQGATQARQFAFDFSEFQDVQVAGFATLIPEPGTAVLLLASSTLVLQRRRN